MNEPPDDPALEYSYLFKRSDKAPVRIDLCIDRRTTTLIPREHHTLPFWTELGYQQCPNCPLNSDAFPHCPVARNLIPLIDICSSIESYAEMDVEIKAPDRTICAHTTAQRAVSSVLGLMMATSPCPHTGYLKPMARFHMPLASEEEAIYRTTSMYLLAQYVRSRKGQAHAYDIEGLKNIYQELQTVNRAMAQRLKAASKEDSAVNAVILLELLTRAVTWSIEDGLEEIAYLFQSYTGERDG